MSERVTRPDFHAVSDVPLEADDFPVLVRIPCDVGGCQREAWTSVPIAGVHGRITLCSVHRSRLQLVLLRFLGLPDATARWVAYDAAMSGDIEAEGGTHSTSMAAAASSPSVVADPNDWLCARCGHGMTGTGKIPFWMHRCGVTLPEADYEV